MYAFVCVCMHVCIDIYFEKIRQTAEEKARGREGEKNTPEHSCPLVAVCSSTSDCTRKAARYWVTVGTAV